MPSTEAQTQEQERQQNFAMAQQQARLQTARAEEAKQQEAKAPLAAKPDAAQEIIKIAKQIPIVGMFVHTVPVLIWLLSIFGKALWAIILAIVLWFPAVFLSTIGLRKLPIPFISLFIKAEIPKTNTIEFLISGLYFIYTIIAIAMPTLLILGLILGAVYLNSHKIEAIYTMFFGPFNSIINLLPSI